MTKEEVKETYSTYRKLHEMTMQIEETLFTASNQDEWIKKLSNKTTFLRATYKENENLLNRCIRPFITGELVLTEEIAEVFLNEIIEMEMEAENDSVMTTEVLKKLVIFYSKCGNMEKEILATFFLGISYADKANKVSSQMAYDCFNELCGFADRYMEIEDWEIRRRLLFAFYNRFTNYDVERFTNWEHIFNLFEEVKNFVGQSEVRELDGNKIDFDEFIQECADSMQWCLVCMDERPSDLVLKNVESLFLDYDITEQNLSKQTSTVAIIYIWYHYWNGDIDCNQVVKLLYAYYCENDKEIDYSRCDFYEDEGYQVQMIYMQEIFRYLALPECDFSGKQVIIENLTKDFIQLYESIPYLNNNAFLNEDMIQILKHLLRSITNEEEAFHHIREVVIRRNPMTLIHSAMVSKIAKEIVCCLIQRIPELFFEFMDTDDIEEVKTRKNELVDYIEKGAYIHDLGKIEISDIINQQTRGLTEEEYQLIKKHPVLGEKILEKTFLQKKYGSLILGHHKFFDNKGGYPAEYISEHEKNKIMIDIITISDCIDAATDMLGRNYAFGKVWIPVVQQELLEDDNHRYNKKIVEAICTDAIVCDQIQYLVGLGRVKIYYDIYQTYLG